MYELNDSHSHHCAPLRVVWKYNNEMREFCANSLLSGSSQSNDIENNQVAIHEREIASFHDRMYNYAGFCATAQRKVMGTPSSSSVSSCALRRCRPASCMRRWFVALSKKLQYMGTPNQSGANISSTSCVPCAARKSPPGFSHEVIF